MKLYINTTCEASDNLYYMKDAKIVSTSIKSLKVVFDCNDHNNDTVNIMYYLSNGIYINENDINKTYFTDKAKLLSYIASQI